MTTHNKHLDTAREVVRFAPLPCPLEEHDLKCAQMLAANARANLAEVFRVVKPDVGLKARVEDAGRVLGLLIKHIELRQGAVQ